MGQNPTDFAQVLFTQRYSPLRTSDSPRNATTKEEIETFNIIRDFVSDCKENMESMEALPAGWKSQLEEKATLVANHVRTFNTVPDAEHIRQIMLQDYVDTCSLSAVSGHHHLAGKFLSGCF